MAAHGADGMERTRVRCTFRACTRGTTSRAMSAVSTGAPRAAYTGRVGAPNATGEQRTIRTLGALARKVRTVSAVEGYKVTAIAANDALTVAFGCSEVAAESAATERTAAEVTLRSGRAGLGGGQYRNHEIFDFECHKATPGKGVLWA
jgi:hypothetical protein